MKILNHKINICEIQDMDIFDQIEVINNGLNIYYKDEEKLCDYIEYLSRKACEIEDERMSIEENE